LRQRDEVVTLTSHAAALLRMLLRSIIVPTKVGQRSLLHDPPVPQKHEPVAEETCFTEVMRYQNDCLAQSAENAPQVRLQIGADDGIEGPQRLIQQQNVRIKHKSPHQPDALALAAGELDGEIIQSISGEPREVDQLRQPGPNA